jgi:hypothetical protein
LTRTRERLVDLWLRFIVFVMLDELHIDWLIMSDTHEVKRGAALANHVQVSSVLGVVKSAEWAIFDTEAIFPQV